MKKVSVLGYGKSGRAAAELARSLGESVSVFDEKISPERLPKPEHAIQESQLVVVSPGIPNNSELIADAISSGAQIISELEYGFRNCKCPLLAVTGTNGKTTTTELATHILKELGMRTEAAGNIGTPLCEIVNSNTLYDCLVLEVSSFQLERIVHFSSQGAALLNITSDHLDRYASFEEYVETKFKIFKNMSDDSNMVLNHSLLKYWNKYVSEGLSPHMFSSANTMTDFFCKDNVIYFNGSKGVRPIVKMSDTLMSGVHNAENIMAALALICSFCPTEALFGEKIQKAIRSFGTGPHRIELVGERDGVKYVNDSKGTNPDAVLVALRTVGADHNVCLILGGLDKEMDFTLLRAEAARVKHAFVIGQAKGRIVHAVSQFIPCTQFEQFDEAVVAACEQAGNGDVVLLSPACASMDMFKDYADRGNQFRDIVHRYLESRQL